jgi:hypothetical protein
MPVNEKALEMFHLFDQIAVTSRYGCSMGGLPPPIKPFSVIIHSDIFRAVCLSVIIHSAKGFHDISTRRVAHVNFTKGIMSARLTESRFGE